MLAKGKFNILFIFLDKTQIPNMFTGGGYCIARPDPKSAWHWRRLIVTRLLRTLILYRVPILLYHLARVRALIQATAQARLCPLCGLIILCHLITTLWDVESVNIGGYFLVNK
jgi:hypothetical protein